MSEAWMIELLGAVRDVARANAMGRLAEHLDDAMLLAASEYHEASRCLDRTGAYVGESAEIIGGPASTGFH